MRLKRRPIFLASLILAVFIAEVGSQPERARLGGVQVGTFDQWVAESYTTANGLPSDDILAIAIGSGEVYAATAQGLVRRVDEAWRPVEGWGTGSARRLSSASDGVYATSEDALYKIESGEAVRIAFLHELGSGSVNAMAMTPASWARPGLVVALEGRVVLIDPGRRGGQNTVVDLSFPSGAARSVAAGPDGVLAVGSASGLYMFDESDSEPTWQRVFPSDGARSWAPIDVRAVTFDPSGSLWFASPQGVGRYDPADQSWKLYTGADGLPYDDFTCVASAVDQEVWFGTRIGAIRFDGETWEYRQGRRWLPGDDVRDIAVDNEGTAWFATDGGVGAIRRRKVAFAAKAKFFEDEIDRFHRRTPYEYVDTVSLARRGDKSEWTQRDSDNDGLWTAMYGAGECFAYAATGDENAKRRAKKAFDALRFLGEVTRGGSHPAPPGFVARTILPTSGPDPNIGRLERDRKAKEEGDALWKVIDPRWPVSEDGKWYWKSDTSSDELDGHFFFYAQYYDLAAETEDERARVRQVVTGIADHLIEHDFSLIDHDGKPTRWANFGPRDLNHRKDWWEERGLNSLSIVSYLRVAEHVSGETKYGEVAGRLIEEHAYAANITVPKLQSGPATGNQSDDEMAFMCFYNLLKYEKDPELRRRWALSFFRYWRLEAPEMNPLFNFMYAASCAGEVYRDSFGEIDLSPTGSWLGDAVDSLKRYPLDRVRWSMKNSHRIDLVGLAGDDSDLSSGRGRRRNGKVLPIDERWVEHWNHDPWRLDYAGEGLALADGGSFLLPYYLGLYHGFIVEE